MLSYMLQYKKKPSVLLVDFSRPVVVGSVHSYLESKHIRVSSLYLDRAPLFYPESINCSKLKNSLLAALGHVSTQRLASLVIGFLGGFAQLDQLDSRQVAETLNRLIVVHRCLYKHYFAQTEIQYYLSVGSNIGANKSVLQLAFPGFLRSHNETDYYRVLGNIKSHNISLVGFHINSPKLLGSVCSMIERIHKEFPNKKIVVFGFYAAKLYKSFLRRYPFIIVVRDEPEQIMLRLVRAGTTKASLQAIRGIVFRLQGKVVETKRQPRFKNIDSLPFSKQIVMQPPCLLLQTSRGCLYQCSFCAFGKEAHGRIRYRSIEHIIQELQGLSMAYPARSSVFIADELFLQDTQRVMRFCDEVIKNNFCFNFSCQGRIDDLSEVVLKKLESAGFSEIFFGLESANEKILQAANKTLNKKKILEVITWSAKTNIRIKPFLIVGLPGETWATIRETGLFIQQMQKIKYFSPAPPNIAMVHPGTDLCKRMEKSTSLSEDDWFKQPQGIFYSVEHDVQTLLRMKEELCTYIFIDKFFTRRGFIHQWPVVLFSRDRFKLWQILCKKIINYILGV